MRHCNNALLAGAICIFLFAGSLPSLSAQTPVGETSVLKGHDFSRAETVLKGRDLAGCGKTHVPASFVTGHDFSRAAAAAISTRALAPAGCICSSTEFFRSLFSRAETAQSLAGLQPLRDGLFAETAYLAAGQTPQSTPPQGPPLTVDRDPVRSPEGDTPRAKGPAVEKEGGQFLIHADVEEVALNATVLDAEGHLVQDLKQENFQVLEDGVKQNIISFQHTDLPVSIALVVDNSGSMATKRPSVNKSALDLVEASNPRDEAFVVNFSDEAFIDQEFTSDINKLRDGLSHIESRGGTALYDAVAASADKLAADARRPKQVLVIITDGEDNASSLDLEQTIRRVQQLSGPVIYSIGLLFGDAMSRSEVRHARRALEMLSTETGGLAFFPKSIEQVDQIAAEVARDIRSQYSIGYHSTKPSTVPGFRHIELDAQGPRRGKLTVRTRTGYFPVVRQAKKTSQARNAQ